MERFILWMPCSDNKDSFGASIEDRMERSILPNPTIDKVLITDFFWGKENRNGGACNEVWRIDFAVYDVAHWRRWYGEIGIIAFDKEKSLSRIEMSCTYN